MGLKFLSASGSGTDSDALEAILYATAMQALASNNSWGGAEFNQVHAGRHQRGPLRREWVSSLPLGMLGLTTMSSRSIRPTSR